MRRWTRLDAGFLAATALGWVALALWTSQPPIDRFFLGVLVACLTYLLRLGAVSWMGARTERRRASALRGVRPDEVAAAAVAQERQRLSEDIARGLRETVAAVRSDARLAAAASDPVPALRRIQEHTRRATSDLRRQLGLLRDAAPAAAEEPTGPATPGVQRRDVVTGVLVTLLALVEVTTYLLAEGYGDRSVYAMPGTIVASVAAAACITWRRVAPVAAAAACAACFGLGVVADAPVGGGFWAIATVGSLAWTLAATAPGRLPTALSWLGLVTAVYGSRRVDDPDNAFIFALIIGVATALGLAVRVSRARGGRAAESSRRRLRALQESTDRALAQHRLEFAREIHDVVSHAVGLVAMQAAAAEVSWPHDSAATRRAIEVIESTTGTTLVELDRLLPGAPPAGPPGLEELVERIRRSGTRVTLVERGEVAAALEPLVYRIVQEGLTNAVRHAPGASVRVEVGSTADGVSVAVRDDGPGPGRRSQSGYGLVGLAERVGFAGGSLTSGPAPDGRGFELQARVPAATVEASP